MMRDRESGVTLVENHNDFEETVNVWTQCLCLNLWSKSSL